MAEEALKQIAFLLDNVPIWIEELEGLLQKTIQGQSEALVPQQEAVALPGTHDHSSHTAGRSAERDEPNGACLATLDPAMQNPHNTQTDALRSIERKRKSGSVCSGRASGPLKYRSHAVVIVHYDSEVQKRLEGLYKNLAGGRNGLRKGKMGAKVDLLSSKEGNDSVDGTKIFDKLDKCLDEAQAMCECAAHQMLRVGDCALELHRAKQDLVDAKTVCEAEIPALQERAQQALQCLKQDQEITEPITAAAEEKTDEPVDRSSDETLVVEQRIDLTRKSFDIDDIEVDDDDEEDGYEPKAQDVMASLRMGRFQLRSTRVVAC